MTPLSLLEPDLRVIRAPNPSPLTGEGTNTYILGAEDLCVIDPGPDNPDHLAAIMSALDQGGWLRAILVTHSHLDHAPLARALAQKTGAPVLAYGDSLAGRSAKMVELAASGLAGGGEGVDHAFRPDQILDDGDCISLGPDQIRAIWTPGHFGNHLCFSWRGAVFSGDHVMGWSTTLVSPPDGDLAAYMLALDRLEASRARVLYPGHGAPVRDPAGRITELRRHRHQREAEILACLSDGPCAIPEMVQMIYTDIPPTLHRAAGRNVFAHLIDLESRGMVQAMPVLDHEATYHRLIKD